MSTSLGDFPIVREIGRGGMGIVYEAIQLSLGRPVALKVLPFAATFDAKHLQRFRQEAQAAAHLHHANIVPAHAVGCERAIVHRDIKPANLLIVPGSYTCLGLTWPVGGALCVRRRQLGGERIPAAVFRQNRYQWMPDSATWRRS